MQRYKKIIAAGGVVFKENSVLMIFRLGKWDFPKGKVEVGEDFETAAVREVEEETGVKIERIERKIQVSTHTYTLNGIDILKETYWFLMRSDFNQTLKPQTEEAIESAVWIPIDEVTEKLENSYSNLRELWMVIQKFHVTLQKTNL